MRVHVILHRAASPETPDAPASSRNDRVGPVVLGGLMVGGLALLSVRDPNTDGSYGLCPFKALTGWDCPFCGGLRGTYSLIHGDVMAALDHNILLPLFWAGLVAGIVAWWRGDNARSHRWKSWMLSRTSLVSIVALLAIFWVVRNIPTFSYLDAAAH